MELIAKIDDVADVKNMVAGRSSNNRIKEKSKLTANDWSIKYAGGHKTAELGMYGGHISSWLNCSRFAAVLDTSGVNSFARIRT